MQAQTVLAQIAVDPLGVIALKIKQNVVSDEGQPMATSIRRESFWPGQDIDTHLASIDANIAADGYPQISADDIARIKQVADAAWTSEVIDTWKAMAFSSAIS